MRVVVFDHFLNLGGGLRYITNLLIAIKKVRPDIDLNFYCNTEKLRKANGLEIFLENGIVVRSLKSLERPPVINTLTDRLRRFFMRIIGFLKRRLKIKDKPKLTVDELLSNEISELCKGMDIAFFPWPYFLRRPLTECPKVATFHDFNFKYFFGAPVFSPKQTNLLNEQIKEWLIDTKPIVSTNFMMEELKSFYPEVTKVEVAHLSTLNSFNAEIDSQDSYPFTFLLDKPYIICSTHLTVHKNIGNIIAAASIVNCSEIKVNFVFTGSGSELIRGKSSYLGLNTNHSDNIDIYGLGYISDKNMNQLLRKSFAVLNASLYEAGNGIGLDAWPLGIPVIQSNIPAFEEHLTFQKLKAFTFDPRNPTSIADAIVDCINNHKLRESNINESLIAFNQVTWEKTAERYIEIFNKTLNSN